MPEIRPSANAARFYSASAKALNKRINDSFTYFGFQCHRTHSERFASFYFAGSPVGCQGRFLIGLREG